MDDASRPVAASMRSCATSWSLCSSGARLKPSPGRRSAPRDRDRLVSGRAGRRRIPRPPLAIRSAAPCRSASGRWHVASSLRSRRRRPWPKVRACAAAPLDPAWRPPRLPTPRGRRSCGREGADARPLEDAPRAAAGRRGPRRLAEAMGARRPAGTHRLEPRPLDALVLPPPRRRRRRRAAARVEAARARRRRGRVLSARADGRGAADRLRPPSCTSSAKLEPTSRARARLRAVRARRRRALRDRRPAAPAAASPSSRTHRAASPSR